MFELVWDYTFVLSQLASCLALLWLRPDVPLLFTKLTCHKAALLLLRNDPSPLLDYLLNLHSLDLLGLLTARPANRYVLFI